MTRTKYRTIQKILKALDKEILAWTKIAKTEGGRIKFDYAVSALLVAKQIVKDVKNEL